MRNMALSLMLEQTIAHSFRSCSQTHKHDVEPAAAVPSVSGYTHARTRTMIWLSRFSSARSVPQKRAASGAQPGAARSSGSYSSFVNAPKAAWKSACTWRRPAVRALPCAPNGTSYKQSEGYATSRQEVDLGTKDYQHTVCLRDALHTDGSTPVWS